MKKRFLALAMAAFMVASSAPAVYAAEITGASDGVTTEVSYTIGDPSPADNGGGSSGGSSDDSGGGSSSGSTDSTDETPTRNAPSFSITIPASINLNETQDLMLSASRMDIESGHAVRVYLDADRSLDSRGYLPMASASGDSFDCWVFLGGAALSGNDYDPVICEWTQPGNLLPNGSNGISFNTVFGCPPNQPDGVYTSRVYFNVRYE